jgi:hypothetical protein
MGFQHYFLALYGLYLNLFGNFSFSSPGRGVSTSGSVPGVYSGTGALDVEIAVFDIQFFVDKHHFYFASCLQKFDFVLYICQENIFLFIIYSFIRPKFQTCKSVHTQIFG